MLRQSHPRIPFVDALPVPSRRLVTVPQRLTIQLQTAVHRFHRDLPPAPVWTFDGTVPGPTVEVQRGVPLEVRWENRLAGTLPVVVTMAPSHAIDGVPVQTMPGRSGGLPDADAAALPGFAVVHLHGGLTYATSDGWAENLIAPDQWALDTYPNDQRGALLWYHDHVMGVTRYSVYAGLAGLWIVRDDRERELGLPEGPPRPVCHGRVNEFTPGSQSPRHMIPHEALAFERPLERYLAEPLQPHLFAAQCVPKS